MIAKPVLIFPNRHMRLSIGDLEKSESGKARADFAPNWSLQLPLHPFWHLFPFHFVPLSHRQCGQNEKKKSAQKLKKSNKYFNAG